MMKSMYSIRNCANNSRKTSAGKTLTSIATNCNKLLSISDEITSTCNSGAAAEKSTEDSDYKLSHLPGSNGKIKLRVEMGGKVIAHDTFDIDNAKRREAFVKGVKSNTPDIDVKALSEDLLNVAGEVGKKQSNGMSLTPNPDHESSASLLHRMPEDVQAEAREILHSGQPLEYVLRDARAIGVVGEDLLKIAVYLIGTSRLLEKPLSAIIQGSSSSGKSFVAKQVAKLFPPESRKLCHKMTTNALYHFPPGALKNRFVVGGERSKSETDEVVEAHRALREMIEDGELNKSMPVRENNKIVTKDIHQEGPIAYIESTTSGNIFDEDVNRCLLLHTDESDEQTRRIIAETARSSKSVADSQRVIDRHHAMQRMLSTNSVKVLVPFAEDIVPFIPSNKVEARRMFKMLLQAIRASAVLHQFQRNKKEDGQVIADERDYEVAHQIMKHPMTEQIGSGVSPTAKEYWGWLRENLEARFYARDCLNHKDNPKGRERTYALISELNGAGCVRTVDKVGNANLYEIGRSPDDVMPCLPTTDELFGPCHSVVQSDNDTIPF